MIEDEAAVPEAKPKVVRIEPNMILSNDQDSEKIDDMLCRGQSKTANRG